MQFQQYLSHLLVKRKTTRYCHSYVLSYLISEPELYLKRSLSLLNISVPENPTTSVSGSGLMRMTPPLRVMCTAIAPGR